MIVFENPRKSFAEIGRIYFWTATIRNWNCLLSASSFKDIIVDSLPYLSSKGLIDVFGFVIMPNYVHFIWRMNKMNGKGKPFGSFLKYTAHQFKKVIKLSELEKDKLNAANKSHEFWQRDSLAIELYSQKVAYQKLDYIHLNPMAKSGI